MARCTWPIEAAAMGSGSHSAKTLSGTSPSSSTMTEDAGQRLEREVERSEQLAHRLSLHQLVRRQFESVHLARPPGQGADRDLAQVTPQIAELLVPTLTLRSRWGG